MFYLRWHFFLVCTLSAQCTQTREKHEKIGRAIPSVATVVTFGNFVFDVLMALYAVVRSKMINLDKQLSLSPVHIIITKMSITND